MNLSPRALAGASARHPWRTVVAWIVLLAVLIAGSAFFGGNQNQDGGGFTNRPESQVAQDLIDTHFGADDRASDTIVFHSDTLTVDDAAYRQVVERTAADLAAGWGSDIASTANYYTLGDAPEAAALVSADRHSLLMPVTFLKEQDAYVGREEGFLKAAEGAATGDVEVHAVGDLSGSGTFGKIADEDTGKDISIGLPAAGVVLVVVFGALVAAFLPLLLGVVAILGTSAVVALMANVLEIGSTTMILATMIGLAVGIDYALFFMERFREERRKGALKVDAIERAGGTAGKALIFSGLTVILALSGLMLIPVTIFQGMALGAIVTVIFAVIAAITLLPALLRLIGDWINFPRVGTMRALKRQDETGDLVLAERRQGRGMWGRIAEGVMHHPAVSAVVAGGLLILAALPVFTMQIGEQSFASMPDTSFTRGYAILARDFAAGMQEPVQIAIEGDATSASTKAQVDALLAALGADDRLADPTVQVAPDGTLILVDAVLTVDPSSKEAERLIDDLRTQVVPSVFGSAASSVHVGGSTASTYDFDTALTDRLPVVFAFVLGLSFLLLMVAFRSLLVPAMSIVLNLLSVGAAYGLVVAVFQHGWGADLFGFTQVDVVTNWLPVLIFCILFGLSMDYHVFLLSRIRERWDETGAVDESIVFGVRSTGRIITGAAAIMVAVFAAFAMGRLVEIQQMGFGLGVAVLVDATIIRTILVPALMKLMGERAWWFPRWLAWMPNPKIEGDLPPIARRVRAARPIAQPTPVVGAWESVSGE
ncbi:MAG: MMPL family transporter [Thermomicrobiales bacterium]